MGFIRGLLRWIGAGGGWHGNAVEEMHLRSTERTSPGDGLSAIGRLVTIRLADLSSAIGSALR